MRAAAARAEGHTELVRMVVRQMAPRLPPHVDRGDLQGVGMLALVQASRRYDASRGVQFRSYAEHRIRGAILDYLRTLDWLPRRLREFVNRRDRVHDALATSLGRLPEEEELAAELEIAPDAFVALSDEAHRGGATVELDEALAADPQPGPQLEAVLVADALETLPERERRIVQLYYFEDQPMSEVGKAIGVSGGRAGQLLERALLRLRRKLRRAAPDELA